MWVWVTDHLWGLGAFQRLDGEQPIVLDDLSSQFAI
jgi:hypothetical protein